MKDKNLIINVRSQMSWYRRLTTNVMTASMWVGWLFLLRPFFGFVGWVQSGTIALRPILLKIIGSSIFTAEGLMTLLGTSGALMLWSLLPSHRPRVQPNFQPVLTQSEFFALPQEEIENGQAASIVIVHHGELGQIVRIERIA